MFEFAAEEFSVKPPPEYLFTCDADPPTKQRPTSGVKVRNREKRRQLAARLGDLDSVEARALEATLGVAPRELPLHLRSYALQRRNAACFSGPGVLPGEVESGQIEYKLRLLDPTPTRFQQLVTQLNWRLSEGSGQCLYALGVEDNGHPRGLDSGDLRASLEVLQAMAAEVGAEAEVLQTPPGTADGRRCAVVRVTRAAAPALNYDDLRVAVAGGVDSGKSTLLGVLSHGAAGAPLLDNGRGRSRMRVFRHKHECESGHTSSISLQQCCYDAQGAVLNYSGLSSLTPAEVAASAARMLRFFDLGGHERYSKTLLHGLTAMLPDYVLLCVSAVAGVSQATHEHLAVALALGIPLLICITKVDLASEAVVAQVADDVRSLLAAAVRQGGGISGAPADLAPLVGTQEQALLAAGSMQRSRVGAPGGGLCVPLFCTSSVTGASLQLLHSFFNALPCDQQPSGGDGGIPAGVSPAGGAAAAASCYHGMQGWRVLAQPGAAAASEGASVLGGLARLASPLAAVEVASSAHFQIDGSFEVPDVGTVYSGTVVSGVLTIGQELLLGPLEGGEFRRVAVAGIHRSKVDVQAAHHGQHATVAVHPLDGGGKDAERGAAAGAAAARKGAAGGLAVAQQAKDLRPCLPDTAGCLHAWMREAGGGTPALAIQGAGSAPTSSLSAQLEASLKRRHSTLLSPAASSGHLTSAGSGPAPKPRKGAVLLEPRLEPAACSHFEAALVLLGGLWPPRGLLSGCYPPDLNETEELDSAMLTPLGGSFDLASAGSCLAHSGGSGSVPGSQQLRAHSAGPGRLHRAPSRRRLAAYTPVVHCGSIRQAAQVVAMRELPAAGAAPAPAGGTGGCVGGFGSQQCGGFPSQLEELEDVLTGLELSGELCGASQAAPQPATQHSTPASYARELAGAMAAAGVLQHTPLAAAATPSSSAPSTAAPGASSASGAGSSGHASSGEATPASTPATPAPTPVAAGGSSCEGASGLQLLAALERERTAAAADNIGCVAAVTFCFMHQPEWLVPGARLIVRDRTTGRTAGAGYVTAVRVAVPEAAGHC